MLHLYLCHFSVPPVTVKGRAACGVGYRQLLVTNLVCSGGLSDLSPPELAALLSTVSHAVPASAALNRQEPDTRGLPPPLVRVRQRPSPESRP